MKKEESISRTIESIKIIEEQIKYFEESKFLFFYRRKSKKYNNKIKLLKETQKELCKMLEYKLDDY